MKKLKRPLLLLLAAALCLELAACGGAETENAAEPADPAVQTETEAGPEEPESPFAADRLPDDLDFGGKTVHLYVRGDTLNTEFTVEDNGEIVNSAIHARNVAVEERLNVTLDIFANTSADFWGEREMFMNTVRQSVMANDGSVDLAAGVSNVMPYLEQEGIFANLLDPEAKYFDFTAPWWSDSLLDQMALRGRLYLVSGDACLGVVKGMMCLWFNRNMLEDYAMEAPYQTVLDGRWTLDRLVEMSSAVSVDLNQNGIRDDGDAYGFLMSNENHAPNFIVSSGKTVAEFDSAGTPTIALGSEWFVDFFEKMGAFMSSPSSNCDWDADVKNDDFSQAFPEGRILFSTGEFSYAERFRDMDFDFGLLPYPKYTEEQDGYYTTSRATFSLFGMPVTADKALVSAVLEAYASESYRSVTPVYYEEALKVKYSRDNISSQMFDLIRGGVGYDFGLVHGVILNGISTTIRRLICGGDQNWSSTYASVRKSLDSSLSALVEQIDQLEN